MKRIVFLLSVFFASLTCMPLVAQAQVGTTTDILTGQVTGPDNKPLPNVEVVVTSAETGITRRKRTGDDGRYTLLFPDGGGQYRVEFRTIGFAPVRRNVARQADEDRLVTDVQLGTTITPQLAPVRVTGRQNGGRQRGDRPTP